MNSIFAKFRLRPKRGWSGPRESNRPGFRGIGTREIDFGRRPTHVVQTRRWKTFVTKGSVPRPSSPSENSAAGELANSKVVKNRSRHHGKLGGTRGARPGREPKKEKKKK